ncbi:alanyl-tRNA synthetase [Halomicroarcula limicola]|uniref:Alanyl-tRNA synthetase n=1 Tax=Haloarcula limicola TaxID=1429915 RepID=A0A8J8C4D7_9EURY|nr:alanyl-tRNA synthetase [Halomicroarcula limicola]MBV0925212.1 alanyl-tRNA synthetase [Halomicroarcula limicola]
MNELTLAVFVVIILGTNVYWWRRERITRQSLTHSRERLEAAPNEQNDTRVPQGDGTNIQRKRAAEAAAEMLETAPETLPEEVYQLEQKVRSLQGELTDIRTQWADSWWNARSAPSVDETSPHLYTVELPDGKLAEAKAFAKRAVDDEYGITIVSVSGEDVFAVGVGDAMVPRFNAEDIADQITEIGGGGGGGDNRVATGGGVAELEQATNQIASRIRNRIQSETISNEHNESQSLK